MINTKVNDIITMLINSIDDLLWVEVTANKSMYKNEKDMVAKSGDGLTTFEVPVRFKLNGEEWVLEPFAGLWIRNKDIPGGSMYVASHGYPNLTNLRNLIFDRFCADLIPTTELVEEKLADICKGISIKTDRDIKIGNIINGDK